MLFNSLNDYYLIYVLFLLNYIIKKYQYYLLRVKHLFNSNLKNL